MAVFLSLPILSAIGSQLLGRVDVSRDRLASMDVRALLRLVSQLHQAADPHTRKRQMIQGLCGLTGAGCGVVAVTHMESPAAQPRLVSAVYYVPDGASDDCLPPTVIPLHPAHRSADGAIARAASSQDLQPATLAFEWPASALGSRRARHLVSSRALRDNCTAAAICLFHSPDRAKIFTARHRLLVDLFHQEACWVYQPDLLLLSPMAHALSPRERETLALLLTGLSEKQIASKLKLSHNTIHHYVKSIHRQFDVSSRGELFTRWTAD